jgi:hypothetical protein
MAVVVGTIQGINLLREPHSGALGRHIAEVFFTLAAYEDSADTFSIAAVGAAIAATRRDGKTVLLKDVCEGQAGRHGTVEFYADTLAVSVDAITGEIANDGGTELDAASGVSDRPLSCIVSYKLS